MKYAFKILVLITGMVLVGCRSNDPVQADFEPAWNVPETWRAGDAETEPFAWSKQFNDGALQALIKQGLLHNHNLQQAALRVQRAQHQAVAAGAPRWPSLEGGLDASRTERNRGLVEGVTTTVTEDYGVALGLSWELDLWGRLADRNYAAHSELEATRIDYEAARLSLASRIAQAWYEVVAAAEQLRIAGEALESSQGSLSTIDDRYVDGLSSALDVRLSRANTENARNNVLIRELSLDQAIRGLELLVGDYPSGKQAVSGALPELTAEIPAGLPAHLVGRRPDLRAATHRLYAAGYKAREAEKDLLPAIRLTGRGGTSTDALSDILDTEFRFSNIAAGLTLPFFQGGRLRANLAAAKTDKELALVGLYESALQAFGEVENAISTEHSLRRQAAALARVNSEYREAEQLAAEEYSDGLTDVLTILDAQRRYFLSQQQLLRVRKQLVQNRITLMLALGGSFEEPAQLKPKPVATTKPASKPVLKSLNGPTTPKPKPATIQKPKPRIELPPPIHYEKPVLPLVPKNLLRLPVEQP